jgi:hypothetical protein
MTSVARFASLPTPASRGHTVGDSPRLPGALLNLIITAIPAITAHSQRLLETIIADLLIANSNHFVQSATTLARPFRPDMRQIAAVPDWHKTPGPKRE